jgi:hypothetical protein
MGPEERFRLALYAALVGISCFLTLLKFSVAKSMPWWFVFLPIWGPLTMVAILFFLCVLSKLLGNNRG